MRGRVGRGRGRRRVAPRLEVGRGVRGRRQRARRQLLLHRALLDVVAKLGGRHAVGTLAARFQLGTPELGLREGSRRECERLRSEGRGGREGGGGGRRWSRYRLYGPETLRLRVKCAGNLEIKTTVLLNIIY